MRRLYALLFPERTLTNNSLLLLLCCLLLATGCNLTKRVPEGDALFMGYDIKVNTTQEVPDKSLIENEMDGAVLPKPNTNFLGLRPKLWIHNLIGPTEKEKGLKYWLSYKLGEPPVLLSAVDTGRITGVQHNRLHNIGYFGNRVASTTKVEKKKAEITFTATVAAPYRIKKIEYPVSDSLPVFDAIRQTQGESLLKVGDPYNLNAMINERERINAALKNQGYFYFSPDLLIFKVDSTVGTRDVNVFVRVKDAAPTPAMYPYTIDEVYVYTNYTLTDTLYASDTIKFEKYYYIPNENFIRARHLMRAVFLEQGELYTRNKEVLTLSRLMGLGMFKYANIRFDPDTANKRLLDAHIYLTPAMKKSLRLEVQGVTKTNNFAGPGFMASFRNRNALKGSELLSVNLVTNYETQVSGSGGGSGLNSYEIGLRTELVFPRFVAPFNVKNLASEFSPKTRIALGYSFLNRVRYFQMNSLQAAYSYNWRPRRPVTYEITPVNLQYVQLMRTTEEFEEILSNRPFLQRTFQQQYILGSIFQFTFNTQVYPARTNHFFYNAVLDLSGNTANAVKSLMGAEKPTEEKPRTFADRPAFLNQPFSQYTRLENDFRYYFNFSKKTQLATRFIAGVGFPYGNSTTLPYIKQFTIGGTNSIRAFRARSIGPGTYNVSDELALSFFDQTGDIKLEGNIEYRFPISGFFRGAVFVDAGNIWLVRESADRPGGEFEANDFMNELAIGTGFGLRVDVEFFVLRFDLGVPLRRPSADGENRSISPEFKLGGNNGMVLNIAIGYPF